MPLKSKHKLSVPSLFTVVSLCTPGTNRVCALYKTSEACFYGARWLQIFFFFSCVLAGTLTNRIQTQLAGVLSLQHRLEDIYAYIGLVVAGTLPLNHQITHLLQDIFNLLPNLDLPEFVQAATATTSDRLMVMYLASVVRATTALHGLISNKVANLDAEKEADDRQKALERRKDKAADDKDKPAKPASD